MLYESGSIPEILGNMRHPINSTGIFQDISV
jgi:hypothetical protein